MRDDSGKPLVVYHGTTHDFEAFDPSQGNVENHYGRALYFTSSKTDLAENYATEAGPDITQRIELTAERIFNDLQEEWDEEHPGEEFPPYSSDEYQKLMEEARQQAKKQIAGQSQGVSMPVYLSLQNPVVVQKNGGTGFELNIDEDGNESGSALTLYHAMLRVAGNYHHTDAQEIWVDLIEHNGESFNAWDFERQVRNAGHYVEDDEGNLASGSFIADVYREMGFDGIIQDAYAEFGVGQYGRMKMEPGTKHYIVWDPRKVKSAIGNVGKFDPANPSITAASRQYPATEEWIGRAKKFLREKWAQRNDEMGRGEIPSNLEGACKFASLFAKELFGGRIVGNPEHQVVQHVYQIIDLTDRYDPNTFRHDKEWFGNPEHQESMQSCMPRVKQWAEEFRQKHPLESETDAKLASDYHRNVGWLLHDGSFKPLIKGESHREGAVRLGLSTDPQDMTEAFDKGAVRVSGNQYTSLEFKMLSPNIASLLLDFILQKRSDAKTITFDWFRPRRAEQEFNSVDDAVEWLDNPFAVMASAKSAAGFNKRVISIDDLPGEAKADLAAEIAEHLTAIGFQPPWQESGAVEANDLRPELFDLADPPLVTVYDAPVESLHKTLDRKYDPGDGVVRKYVEMLKSGVEFDPIFVNNGEFSDGGHRLEAYYRAGRKTIPVAEIGPFLNAPAEFWQRWLSGDENAKFAAFPKTALNVPRLVKDFGQKLVARAERDHSAPTVPPPRPGAEPATREQQVEQRATTLVNSIAQSDPSPNKEYTAWIVGNYARGGINRWEDIKSRAIPALKRFNTLKITRKLPLEERDIMKVKGMKGLEDLMEKYKEVEAISETQKEKEVEAAFFQNGGAAMVHDDPQIKVVTPKTKEAACFFGINTRWCTSAQNSYNYFESYNKKGPLYIVLIKANNQRFQFHFETESYMDERDNAVDPWDLTSQYPVLKKIFQPVVLGFMRNNANIRASFVAFVEKPTTEMMLAAVDEDPSAIDHFPNAPQEVKWRAFCRRMGFSEENYDKKLKGFVVAEYENVEEFAEERGNDTAKWAAGISSGKEDWDSDGSGFEASTVLDACKPTTIAEINEYIKFHHDASLQPWLKANEETFPLDASKIEQFMTDEGLDDVEDKLRSGWYSGEESGAQDEVIGAFKSALTDINRSTTENGTVIVFDQANMWDSKVLEILPLAEAENMVKENPGDTDLWDSSDRYHENEILKVEQPYYGFSGFSEEACNERISEEFYISDKERKERAGQQPELPLAAPAKKKRRKTKASLLEKRGVREKSVDDLGLAKKVMRELIPVLGEQLPEPELKVVNQPRAGWLGRDTWRVGIQNGKPTWGDNTTIELQAYILNDENTLRRIIAHELAHHADALVNGVEEMKKVNDKWTYKWFLRENRGRGHGMTWKQYAQKFNAKYGADFVTEKSDESYVTEEQELRPYHILLKRDYDGKLAYEVSSRISPKMKRILDRMASNKDGTEYRLTQTNDRDFYEGQLISSYYWNHPKEPEKQAKLEALWEKGQRVLPTGTAKEQDELVRLWNEAKERSKARGKAKVSDAHSDRAKTFPDADAFLKEHYTGFIPSNAYDSKDWSMWKREDFPVLLKTFTLKDGTEVELRKTGEPNKYTKVDESGEIVRDTGGLATYLSPEEVKAKGLPETDTAIFAFIMDGDCVGQASDEWGADGVWVAPQIQRQGLGTELLTELRKQFKPTRQMGQMTPAGREMAKKYYNNLLLKEAAVPQLQELQHGVSKDYDRVRWVYQQFLDSRVRSMPWQDFQKRFPWAQNSPLFTEVRQNRPRITTEDMERWMDEYDAKAKEYQNYEIEHGTYRDKETSFRDVEQLVLKVNQSASAREIVGEDPMMKEFLGQVAQGSAQSGHPAGESTVGWLRVDFIDDDWLLVDEVQSDLINAMELGKRFLAEPTLESLMSKYKSETVKQKIRDMGATEQTFQMSKREMVRRGYTVEKLEEMKRQLVNLFKDWAEYGIASLIEIARRHGIRNVAIHTGETVARRDPDLEADKAGMYYDRLAKSFGFRKQPLDVGDLKGTFWVRTASAKMPKHLYHGTSESNIAKILKEGIKIKHVRQASDGIYLTDNPSKAAEYSDSSEVLRIDTKALDSNKLRPDSDDLQAFWEEHLSEAEKEQYGNSANVPWQAVVHDLTQITYVGDIPPEAIQVIRVKTAGKRDEDVGDLKGNFWVRTASKTSPVTWEEVKKHITKTNPHEGARDAWGGMSVELPNLAWAKELIQPNDPRLDWSNLHPASKRDIRRYIKFHEKSENQDWYRGFPAVILTLENGRLFVQDGAHRLAAIHELGIPVEAYVGRQQESKQAGKRDEATTSMTVGTTDPSFPMPVLIRWEQGMRWRQVLKAVKAIVGEIAGRRVPWREIHIWASLWENQQVQQEGWATERAIGNRVMYDILHNGSFVSVGKQVATATGAEPEPEYVGNCTEDEVVAQYFGDATRLAQAIENGEKRSETEVFDPTSNLLIKYDPATDVHSFYKTADSHKVTPLDETYYNSPESGEETNAYADVPERVRGIYDVPPLKELAPQLFEKDAAGKKYPFAAVKRVADRWFRKNWRTVQSGWGDQVSYEVGFTIYLDQNGKVQMTKLAQGDTAEVEIPAPPEGCIALGSLHTHSGEGGGELSPWDEEEGQRVANEQGSSYWMFVVGPNPLSESSDIPGVVMVNDFFEPETQVKKGALEGVEYRVNVLDSHGGELFCTAEAWLNGERVGTVDFNESEADVPLEDTRYYKEVQDEYGAKEYERIAEIPKEVWIKHVWVEPTHRRKGIATGMYEKIKQEFPGEKIVSSGTTPEGGEFRKKLKEHGVLAHKMAADMPALARSIQDAIEEAGQKIPRTNWEEWLRKAKARLSERTGVEADDLLDDAITEAVVNALFRDNLAKRYDPSRGPSNYLTFVLGKRVMSGGEEYLQREARQQPETMPQERSDEIELVENKKDAQKFVRAFGEWLATFCSKTLMGCKPAVTQKRIWLLSMVMKYGYPKRRELVGPWQKTFNLSLGALKGYLGELKNLMREFARTGGAWAEAAGAVSSLLAKEASSKEFKTARLQKNAVYAEAQNQVQHTDHEAVGMTKTLKSDPFAEEMEALHKDLGQEVPEPNPAITPSKGEGQPQAKGEDQLQLQQAQRMQQASLLAAKKPLLESLEALRPAFVKAAQEAYENGPEHEWQGVCYWVASAILEEALSHNPGWGGKVVDCGEHHSCAVVCDRKECFRVDIPFAKYEKLIPREEKPGNKAYDYDMPWSFETIGDVVFKPEDIEIVPTKRPKWGKKSKKMANDLPSLEEVLAELE